MAAAAYEPTYSETATDGMFRRALAGRITPQLQGELKQLGIDLDRPTLAAYSQAAWEGGVKRAAEQLFPGLPIEKAYFELGKLYMVGFQSTLVGKAVTQLGKLIGPERTLLRMERNQRTTNNYSVLRVEKLAATHFRLHASMAAEYLPRSTDVLGTHLGDLVSGIYFGVLTLLEVKNPRSTFRPVAAAEFRYEYDLTWDP
jgi:uncharacterized protein (TIGR02265 family)